MLALVLAAWRHGTATTVRGCRDRPSRPWQRLNFFPLPPGAGIVAAGTDEPGAQLLLERPQAPHHAVEDGLAGLVLPVGVVHLSRPVHADSDEIVMLVQEFALLVVQQHAIPLDGGLLGLR